MTKELPDWAKSIMAQALMEIQSVDDIDKVMAKVEGTALAVHKEAWKSFNELVKSKKKMLESRG
jgi:fructose 1,6-bisphosphatase